MAHDFGSVATQTSSYDDLYTGAGTSSTAALNGTGVPPGGGMTSATATGAITASPAGGSIWNPFFVGLAVMAGLFIGWKLWHEWGHSHEEFAELKMGVHNVIAVTICALIGIPGAKALLNAVPWPWKTWQPWVAFVEWCTNA